MLVMCQSLPIAQLCEVVVMPKPFRGGLESCSVLCESPPFIKRCYEVGKARPCIGFSERIFV